MPLTHHPFTFDTCPNHLMVLSKLDKAHGYRGHICVAHRLSSGCGVNVYHAAMARLTGTEPTSVASFADLLRDFVIINPDGSERPAGIESPQIDASASIKQFNDSIAKVIEATTPATTQATIAAKAMDDDHQRAAIALDTLARLKEDNARNSDTRRKAHDFLARYLTPSA